MTFDVQLFMLFSSATLIAITGLITMMLIDDADEMRRCRDMAARGYPLPEDLAGVAR